MFPAVNAWTLADCEDPAVQIELAACAGLGLELVVREDGALTPATTRQRCDALRSLAADCGVPLVGLASARFWEINYADADAGRRLQALDLTRQLLDLAAALGVAAVLVVPAVVGRAANRRPRVAYADALQRTRDALDELRFDAEARDVTIAVENVWNRFLLSPAEAADLIDLVNSPCVGFYLDTGNVLPFGYPEDWIDTLGGRIARVHAKDYDLNECGRAGFCPLGAGSVNWAEVVQALDRAGYSGPLTYEGPLAFESNRRNPGPRHDEEGQRAHPSRDCAHPSRDREGAGSGGPARIDQALGAGGLSPARRSELQSRYPNEVRALADIRGRLVSILHASRPEVPRERREDPQ